MISHCLMTQYCFWMEAIATLAPVPSDNLLVKELTNMNTGPFPGDVPNGLRGGSKTCGWNINHWRWELISETQASDCPEIKMWTKTDTLPPFSFKETPDHQPPIDFFGDGGEEALSLLPALKSKGKKHKNWNHMSTNSRKQPPD